MKKNIFSFFKNYWILLLSLSLFTGYILPPCFQNNNNINIVLAEHVDSGSILTSILQLKDKSKVNSFYNQNLPYHTIYGFPYNSIVFWSFSISEHLFKINTINNFSIYPLIAKLLNFLFASLSIIYLYQLSKKILKYPLSKIILLSLFLIFPPFLHYTFHIKSDILGLLFSIISLNYLFNFLQNSDNTKNIIKANIFGGLSILCKQPHIFIIFPLFIGFIFTIKGNLKEKIIKFLKVYLYSGIIFLLLFFLIHPYAFIEPGAFIAKQRSLLGMTAATYTDNLNFWIPTYIQDPFLFITAFIPFIFIFLNLFKKFRNKITKYLTLISLYLITYILWLSFKVGPMRFVHYLIPVFPFSLLLFSYIFDYSLFQSIHTKSHIKKFFHLITIILFIIFSIKCFKYYVFYTEFTTTLTTKSVIQSVYSFKETTMYKATKKFENEIIDYQSSNKSIIFSISLPINNNLYKQSKNTWQFPYEYQLKEFKPNYLLIDFTVYWEKPYNYWKDIAKQNGLNKEILFIDNQEKEKNIVLFY